MNTDKQMLNIRRFFPVDIELSEVEIIQNFLELLDTLLQYLFSVRNK